MVAASPALADDGLTPDQKRMRACNTQAKEKSLEGNARSRFLTSCLNGGNGGARKLTPKQQKNQDCNRQAREQAMQGAERRGFMGECEKSDRVKERRAQGDQEKGCKRRAAERRLEGEQLEKFLAGCLNGSAAAGR